MTAHKVFENSVANFLVKTVKSPNMWPMSYVVGRSGLYGPIRRNPHFRQKKEFRSP